MSWRNAWKMMLISMVGFLLVTGCKRGKTPNSGVEFERYGMGKVRDVVIVSDSTARDIAEYLASFLSIDTFYTPHPEPLFFVHVVDISAYQDSLRGFRNSIVLATDGSASLALVREAFGGSVKYGIHSRKEALTEGGYMVGIYEPDLAVLKKVIDDSAFAVRDNLLARIYDQYRHMEYFAGVRKDIPKELAKKYGFTLELPNGYAYAIQDTDFVCLAKHYPDRFMFFYMSDHKRSLDPDSLMALRDSLTKKYYDGDYILRNLCVVEADTFLGHNAVRVTGPWQNGKTVMGGPFRFYAFNANNRFYMVDAAVYAPDKLYKLGYIMRMETVVRTMRFTK